MAERALSRVVDYPNIQRTGPGYPPGVTAHSPDRAVDDRLVDHALLDSPHRRDGPLLAGLDHVLHRLPQRLRQR
jgi:hypothetical protein